MTRIRASRRQRRQKEATGAVQPFVFRLYVSGVTAKSLRAVANIKSICNRYLRQPYDLEIVDICQQPHLAQSASIVATPMLIKQLPLPLRRLVGDLSDHDRVVLSLDIPAIAADDPKP